MAAARGAGMAVACMASIALSAGGMAASAADARTYEGHSSMHKAGLAHGERSDKAMTHMEVIDIASHVPRPGDKMRTAMRTRAMSMHQRK
ncbi:hypothetical protein HDZ31DRAFT_35084 [Schizophyllum fasciatum]